MNGQKKLGSVYSLFSKVEGGDVKKPKGLCDECKTEVAVS